ncbi:hypothetical protein GWI33_007971 [Rhynchophorus ferrugineus]|uniref:Uncharacterized protein n=1 Tax=Rhynchophorus ferrugineus TaxID=354439 RepID=A0A834MEH5_RHYFE|nr:hypothetical protein GWI33_007971 [Rhynchophorus ferrugineus]
MQTPPVPRLSNGSGKTTLHQPPRRRPPPPPPPSFAPPRSCPLFIFRYNVYVSPVIAPPTYYFKAFESPVPAFNLILPFSFCVSRRCASAALSCLVDFTLSGCTRRRRRVPPHFQD